MRRALSGFIAGVALVALAIGVMNGSVPAEESEAFSTAVSPYVVGGSAIFPGPGGYADGLARRTVAEDGTFTWQRRTGKKIYVLFITEDRSVQSDRIIIRPPR